METTLAIQKVEISNGYHLIIEIYVNNKKCRMILDTAASSSIFDKKQISKKFKNLDYSNDYIPATTASGATEQQYITLKKVELKGIIIDNYRCAVINLDHINKAYKQLKIEPVDGMIGADVLVKYAALIDLSFMELVLYELKVE